MNRVELAGVPALVRAVGLWRALRVGWQIEAAKRSGRPWQDLGPPADEAERLSRDQAGPAILLYLALAADRSQTDALAITQAVVTASTVVFLRQTLGALQRDRLNALDDGARRDFVEVRGARFFNADLRWDAVTRERVAFTVSRCRFVELCAAIDVPEMAPVFCAGDAYFFGTVEPGVQLDRPETLAGGGSKCTFALQWAPVAAPDAPSDPTS